MAKKKNRLPKTQENTKILGKNISPQAFEVDRDINTNNLSPTFGFKSVCNNHFQLSEWQPGEIQQLITTFKKLESLSWTDILKQKGLGYKSVDPRTFSKDLPENISPDLTIVELRVTKKARLFGYRSRNIFNVIWFDRNHDVYPM